MLIQFSDGEFSGPVATSLKIWKKINSFIVIIAFSVTLEKLNGNPQACPPPPPSPQKIASRILLYSPLLENLLRSPCWLLLFPSPPV